MGIAGKWFDGMMLGSVEDAELFARRHEFHVWEIRRIPGRHPRLYAGKKIPQQVLEELGRARVDILSLRQAVKVKTKRGV